VLLLPPALQSGSRLRRDILAGKSSSGSFKGRRGVAATVDLLLS
jgi:hypothetical protein